MLKEGENKKMKRKKFMKKMLIVLEFYGNNLLKTASDLFPLVNSCKNENGMKKAKITIEKEYKKEDII